MESPSRLFLKKELRHLMKLSTDLTKVYIALWIPYIKWASISLSPSSWSSSILSSKFSLTAHFLCVMKKMVLKNSLITECVFLVLFWHSVLQLAGKCFVSSAFVWHQFAFVVILCALLNSCVFQRFLLDAPTT